jgi:integrase
MSVRKRKDGRWQIDVVTWVRGERVRVKKSGGRTRAEALELERAERRRLEDGGPVKRGRCPTVADFATAFLDGYVAANCKPSTATAYRMHLERHLVPEIGELPVDEVGPREVERYKAKKLAAKLEPKTVNNHLTTLRRMLAVAVEWGTFPGPVPKVRPLPLAPRRFDFLTFEESARLLEAVTPAWRPMVLLALRTGLRQGELLALRWEDVDLVAGRLMVRRSVYAGHVGTPKGGREREVPLSDEARAALRTLPSRFAGELVFPREGGRYLTPPGCRRPLWTACKKADLRHIMWHALRHTFASHLVMRGVAIKAVQELLGHASLEMTMRYAHLSPDVRRDAVALLDAPASAGGSDRVPIGSRS